MLYNNFRSVENGGLFQGLRQNLNLEAFNAEHHHQNEQENTQLLCSNERGQFNQWIWARNIHRMDRLLEACNR